jgi:hypothetical protein
MRDCLPTIACLDVEQCYDEAELYCTNDPTHVFEVACERDLVECEGIANPTTTEIADCVSDYEMDYQSVTCHIDDYLSDLADCLDTLSEYCDWDWPIETCEDNYM